MQIIGAANEFWRLRITRIGSPELDFEWHDDILYREPDVEPVDEVESWNVEAVELGDSERVVLLGSFREREDAEEYAGRAAEDLAEMTKAQFESAYVDPCEDESEDGDEEASA